MEWESLFDSHFWPPYPKKVAKIEARRAWMEISPVESSDSREHCNRILDRLEWFLEEIWKGREIQYVPNPASWLRAEVEDFNLGPTVSRSLPRNSRGRTRSGQKSAVLRFPSGITPKARSSR